MIGNKYKVNRGFTLVEILVVMAIFSILGVLLISVFIMALQSQRQTSQRQRTLASIRYVVESISRQVRSSEIYYDYYNNAYLQPIIGSSEEVLALINQQGNRYIYQKNEDELGRNFISLRVIKTVDGQDFEEQALLTNPEELDVKKLYFYINPIANPFSNERCNETSDCLRNSCTINDPDSDESGFCCCTQNSDCKSLNCDLSQESGDLFNQYCNGVGSGGTCLPFSNQPEVTVVLEFESAGTRVEDQKTVNLQTTISSRVYKR